MFKSIVICAVIMFVGLEFTSPDHPITTAADDQLATNTRMEIDKVRAAHGLPPLIWDPFLDDQAKAHSLQMARTNRFEHSMNDVFENIYMGYPSGWACVDAWMNSPGHRANLLEPTITRAGIGVGSAYTTDVYYTFQAVR